jgi:hypothetical protein
MKNQKLIPAVIIGLLVAIIGYYVLNAPDTRDPGQKIGDAINELHNGPEKAARQLEDRTPGDKLQDVAQDKKEEIQKALNQQ